MDANPALQQFLKSIPLFSLVEPPEMMDLLRLLRPIELQPGQVLFREREPGTAMWVLGKDCEVSISATPPHAKRPVVVAYAKAGETVGEMALVDDGGRSGTAVVVQGGLAHQIDAVDFEVLRDAYNPAAFKVLRKICIDLCRKLRATDDRIVPVGEPVQSPPLSEGKHAGAEVLDEFAPFKKLPSVVKLALARQVRLIETDGVQPIFGEGEQGDAAYFVLSGEVSIGRSGKTLANMGPGAMFGIVAVIDQGGRSASVVATGPTRLLRLSKHDFDTLFNAGNRFAFQLVDLVARQLVASLRVANQLLPQPGQGSTESEAALPEGEVLPDVPDDELAGFDEPLDMAIELEL